MGKKLIFFLPVLPWNFTDQNQNFFDRVHAILLKRFGHRWNPVKWNRDFNRGPFVRRTFLAATEFLVTLFKLCCIPSGSFQSHCCVTICLRRRWT